MSRAADEVKYSSSERELLLRTLSVLEKKCEDVNRTAEKLETLESGSNLFLGSLALSKTQREYLDFLKRRKEAVAKSLEELLAAKESGATGKREPGNVANLRRAMANRPDTVDAVWDVCAGSRVRGLTKTIRSKPSASEGGCTRTRFGCACDLCS